MNHRSKTVGVLLHALTGLVLLLSSCGRLDSADTVPIPPLDPKGDVYKTEGENDPLIYGSAVGKKKMIFLYLEFQGQDITESTKVTAEKMLAGGTFEELFEKQSYGKLDLDITHVHGWRTLPKKRDQYGTKETEPHRDLFVDVFKQYPKIDFRTYDYIAVKMFGLGNTAFGERDDKAIPYRGEKINVALNIGSNSYFVLAHELGHVMGLPDLYTYGGVEGPKNPMGPWDVMSECGRSSGFCGWHRHKLTWLDADRKTCLAEGTHRLTVTPLDADKGLSMIVVPVENPEKPSTVFVVEVARPVRKKKGSFEKPDGILVYSVDARVKNGHNPVVAYPRVKTDIYTVYRVGDRFEHKDAPMTVTVIKKLPSGAYQVEIEVVQVSDTERG